MYIGVQVPIPPDVASLGAAQLCAEVWISRWTRMQTGVSHRSAQMLPPRRGGWSGWGTGACNTAWYSSGCVACICLDTCYVTYIWILVGHISAFRDTSWFVIWSWFLQIWVVSYNSAHPLKAQRGVGQRSNMSHHSSCGHRPSLRWNKPSTIDRCKWYNPQTWNVPRT